MTTTHLNNTTPYATCPIELMAMKELNGFKLTANAKILYMAMANDYPFYVRERGFYQPLNKHLAEKTGMAESTVRTALTILENVGLIEVLEAKDGFCKKYRVNPVSVAKGTTPKPAAKPKPKPKPVVETVKKPEPVIEQPVVIEEKPVEAPVEPSKPVYTNTNPTLHGGFRMPQKRIQKQSDTITNFGDLFYEDSERPF